jgi:hypothetical protein
MNLKSLENRAADGPNTTVMIRVPLPREFVCNRVSEIIDNALLGELTLKRLREYTNDIDNWFSYWPESSLLKYDPMKWSPAYSIENSILISTDVSYAVLRIGFSLDMNGFCLIDGWDYDDREARRDSVYDFMKRSEKGNIFLLRADDVNYFRLRRLLSNATFYPGSVILCGNGVDIDLPDDKISTELLIQLVEKSKIFALTAYDDESLFIYAKDEFASLDRFPMRLVLNLTDFE